ncbi:MAG: hypothetical protein Q4G39_03850 [Brachymonas sp.]|nr:hypothetical protein [Brachymonas sp.]
MSNTIPPRFVPTLTETTPSLTPSTAIIEDTHLGFERQDPSDSLLDLDLNDLDGPVSRIEQVSPLGAYQGGHVVNPLAVNNLPVNVRPAVARPVAAPPVIPPRPAPAAATPAAPAPQVAIAPQPPAQRPVAPPPTPTLQAMLPPDWQNQLQQVVHNAVRQELQQQMPFLLLQWSKQIEDKLSPHIHQQLLKLVVGWNNQRRS